MRDFTQPWNRGTDTADRSLQSEVVIDATGRMAKLLEPVTLPVEVRLSEPPLQQHREIRTSLIEKVCATYGRLSPNSAVMGPVLAPHGVIDFP